MYFCVLAATEIFEFYFLRMIQNKLSFDLILMPVKVRVKTASKDKKGLNVLNLDYFERFPSQPGHHKSENVI